MLLLIDFNINLKTFYFIYICDFIIWLSLLPSVTCSLFKNKHNSFSFCEDVIYSKTRQWRWRTALQTLGPLNLQLLTDSFRSSCLFMFVPWCFLSLSHSLLQKPRLIYLYSFFLSSLQPWCAGFRILKESTIFLFR